MDYWRRDRSSSCALLWLVVIGALAWLLAPSLRRLWNRAQGQGMAVTMSNLASQTKTQMGQYIDLTKFMKRKSKSEAQPSATRQPNHMAPEMADMGDLTDQNAFDDHFEPPERGQE
ncbi:hypothetical protein CLV36_11816 [Laceyella sediminis]|uniref:DUF4834 family protein n=1 Tax=Laceyella sediminis TaxID=573074 RepID=A0ABX5EJP5_9BACL|nr:hypothetical protein [Laceyella sediminis]PRZ11951.1 hypothetical protein CLV36_11816 [Laceyella sediminis]